MITSPSHTITYPARAGDTGVDLLSGAERRWSPVRFDRDADVDPEDLVAVLEAARWAPSTFGEQPWRFLVARRDDPWRGDVERSLKPGNAWARAAGVLIVGLTKTTFDLDGRTNQHARHDLGLALAGIVSEAMARGLVTHAMAGFDPDAVRTAFDVPEGFDLVWITALGHHDPELDDPDLAERERRPRRRRALDDLVFGARFGAAADL